MFTLDWHTPDINILDTGYSVNPGQHKCGHVIEREDGNYAIQPNNRIRLWDPSYTTKKGENLIDRLINETLWDVEDGDKWLTSDDDRYDYEVVAKKDTNKPTEPTQPTEPTGFTQSTEALVVESNITYNQPFHGAFYDQERTNEWYWK